MKEAQGFDVLLEPAGYVVGITPETRSVEFVSDILHHKTKSSNPSRLGSCIAGGLVQDSMDEKDDLPGGGRDVAARLNQVG